MFPVLVRLTLTAPHSSGRDPVVETPDEVNAYSIGFTFWSYMMTMSSNQNPMSFPTASVDMTNRNLVEEEKPV